jgi:hypothetical protein
MLSVLREYSISDRMINEIEAVDRIKSGSRNKYSDKS